MLAVVGAMGQLSSFLGRPTPLKTSSSVKDKENLTSLLSSMMLSANRCCSFLFGRLFCLAKCCRALVYAIAFSLGISLMSQLV